MGTVIRQRHEIYNYDMEKDRIPKRGEKVVITGTPDVFSSDIIEMIADGEKTVSQLYEQWKNRENAPFLTKAAFDEKVSEISATEAAARQTAINNHNASNTAHSDLRQEIVTEAQERDEADQHLQEQISLIGTIEETGDLSGLVQLIIAEKHAREQAVAGLNISRAPIDSPVFTGIPKVPGKGSDAKSDGTLMATEAQVYTVRQAVNVATADYRRTASSSIIPNASQTTRVPSWADVYNTVQNAIRMAFSKPTGLDIMPIANGVLRTSNSYDFKISILPDGTMGEVEVVDAHLSANLAGIFDFELGEPDALGLVYPVYFSHAANAPIRSNGEFFLTVRLKDDPEITFTGKWTVVHELKE